MSKNTNKRVAQDDQRYFTYETEHGSIVIVSDGSCVTGVYFGKSSSFKGKNEQTVLLDNAAMQLEEYFSGKRKHFDVPISACGTEFQRLVWASLLEIPYGQTRSYKYVAQSIGNPKACRAVGLANNRNPISIIVPCHRVIGSSGALTGYGGGLDLKQKLLDLEKRHLGYV